MQGINSEHEYKVGSVGWVSHEIHRQGGVGQFYPHGGVGWRAENFTEQFYLSQVRHSVLSSDKLLSTAFWIKWEKACFYWWLLW